MNNRPSRHAHHLVHETAVGMAHELYDYMMLDDGWYRHWKRQHPELSGKALEDAFVERNISKLLPQARAVLAQMLQTTQDEKTKEAIYEALTLDATLVRGRSLH
jgi:hypothetical protein